MSDKKAVIKNADMPDDMQQDAVDYAMQAMEKYNIEKDIAAHVKKACKITDKECVAFKNADDIFFSFAGVWQKVQPHMALHHWEELWQLCDTWDKTLHLFLPRSSGHTIV